MKCWYDFWVMNFVLAGSAFGLITFIVLIRGARELREMFLWLRAARPPEGTNVAGGADDRR